MTSELIVQTSSKFLYIVTTKTRMLFQQKKLYGIFLIIESSLFTAISMHTA